MVGVVIHIFKTIIFMVIHVYSTPKSTMQSPNFTCVVYYSFIISMPKVYRSGHSTVDIFLRVATHSLFLSTNQYVSLCIVQTITDYSPTSL